MKSFIFVFLIILLFFSACDQQSTTPSLKENFVNIPDKNFLNALIEAEVDINGDSLISDVEAKAHTILSIRFSEILDLTGIESFENLNSLSVDGNKLTSLDVSNNTDLRELYCQDNQITSLDVSNNSELIDLYCHENQIASLDVSNNAFLKVLHFRSNKITEIDVSNNLALTQLNCGGNQLSSLYLSNNNALSSLSIHKMPTLKNVCLPTRQVDIEGGNSNIIFSRECSGNIVNISDVAFLFALIDEGIDTNSDNLITYEEAESVTSLNLSWKGIYRRNFILTIVNQKWG